MIASEQATRAGSVTAVGSFAAGKCDATVQEIARVEMNLFSNPKL